ncbi:MAG TPA: thioredoxin domain-containing protein, partial [Chitinophagaceae bacterium]|nr:thioredoxin domain-containing protein [Chitinophagaceae bacterium]
MNLLSKETSPYLLQHAHNPVEWYPWGEEALSRARAEDKPILVSIGYSACHWCHVMERESFEDEGTAAIMNQLFVNIKIDREERPDLDHIYMDAVQAMSGSGGWPLNVFLTPDARPFYGGTYFPPTRLHNRASWTEVLQSISKAFKEQRDQIEEQANQLTEHLQKANSFGTSPINFDIPREERFTPTQLEQAFTTAMAQADRTWGGFGKAPKFPQTFTIHFLLNHYWFTGKTEALDQAILSLDKMIMGGIYDHLGGGFARYSTDTEWLAPHFEKMLYDNALLVMVLCEAYQLTGKERYARTIRETLNFVQRELMSEEFGFYSALDADSEGVEGKFYTWALEQIRESESQEDRKSGIGELFCRVYDISPEGNWEHVNIPRLKKWPEELGLTEDQLMGLSQFKSKLLAARSKRVRPGLDDKILLSWNALMNQAFARAAMVLEDNGFKQVAVRNMDFLLRSFVNGGKTRHSYKNGVSRVEGFLEDQAYLLTSLITMHELTSDAGYLRKARVLLEETIEHYSDEDGLFFYFTRDDQEDIIVRKKEIYDGATPSGNSLMANVLLRLGILFDEPGWQERAVKMVDSVSQMATRYPTSFGIWADLLQELVHGTLEIVVLGENALEEGR